MKNSILFVCKFNRTRSRMAEAIFKKLNKNKNWTAESAGIIKDEPSKELLRDLRMFQKINNLKFTSPKYLSKKLMKNQKIIIIVADDVHTSLFNSQKKSGIKIIRWKIKDGWKYKKGTRLETFEKIKNKIEKKIVKLLKTL